MIKDKSEDQICPKKEHYDREKQSDIANDTIDVSQTNYSKHDDTSKGTSNSQPSTNSSQTNETSNEPTDSQTKEANTTKTNKDLTTENQNIFSAVKPHLPMI